MNQSVDQVALFFQQLLQTESGQLLRLFISLIVGVAGLYLLLIITKVILQVLHHLTEKVVFFELTPPKASPVTSVTPTTLFQVIVGALEQSSWLSKLLLQTQDISLEVVSQKESGIRYLLRIPESLADVLERSLRAYLPGLQIKRVSDYLDKLVIGINKTRVLEFCQARHLAFPLQQPSDLEKSDPLAFMTGQMTQLSDTETLALQIIVSPTNTWEYSRMHRQVNHLRALIRQDLFAVWSRRHNRTHNLLQVAARLLESFAHVVITPLLFVSEMITGQNSALPKKAPENLIPTLLEREQEGQIKTKIGQSLSAVTVRTLLLVGPQRLSARQKGFRSSFTSFSNSSQSFKLRPGWLPMVRHRVGWWQFKNRHNSKRNFFTPTELASLYHFPGSLTHETEDLIRLRSRELPAPLSLKKSVSALDNVFAVSRFGNQETPVGQTLEERRRHTYILGATGSGKTTLLSQMIKQDILGGKGLCVVDPHGQLAEEVLGLIPKERIEDVVWFAPDNTEWPIAINLLEIPNKTELPASQIQKQKSLIASQINSIFQKFYDARYFGPRMEYILRNAVLTALETPEPTLLTVLDILTKAHVRKQVVASLKNQVLKDFWRYEFEKLGSLQKNQAVSPITNKIGGLLSSPINYQILTQPKSSLDFDTIINEGKILLCDLSKGKIGEDETSFFGSLIIAKIQLAALRRIHIPENDRHDFFLYVDEFQNFATTTFSELVSEARKYRLATVLAHQSISQIEDRDIVKVILANMGSVICFKTANPEDEQFMLPLFSPEVAKHEIMNLPLYTFYMKLMVGHAKDAFQAQVEKLEIELDQDLVQDILDSSRKLYGINAKTISRKRVYTEAPVVATAIPKRTRLLGRKTEL